MKKFLENSFGLRHYKLRTKLMLMAIVVSLMPIVIVSYYNLSSASQMIEDGVFSKNQLYIKMAHERIHSYFTSRETDAIVLAKSTNMRQGLDELNTFNASPQDMRRIEHDFQTLISETVTAYGFTDIFITNKYKEVVYSLNYNTLDLSPLVISDTFVEDAMNGEQNWSNLFRNSFIDDNILVLSTPIYSYESANQTQVIGTLNMVLNQSALNHLVHDGIEAISENGDTYLITENGVLLTNTLQVPYNDDAALINSIETKAASVLKEAIVSKNTDFNKTIEYHNITGDLVIGSLTVTKVGDEYVGFITEMSKREAFGILEAYKNTAIIIALVIILFSMILAILLSNSISYPINRVIRIVDRISNYQLNIDREELKDIDRNDEIGNLERAILRISDNLIVLLKEVDLSAEEVVNASSHLHGNALSSLEISREAEKSVTEIAVGSQEQGETTEEALSRTSALNNVLGDNQKELKRLVHSMKEVESLVTSGLEIVNALNVVNQENMETNAHLMEGIEKSHESFRLIEGVTELIIAISEKTNLLSLNASLEASRAGEHGLGFAVVSDEIRKLAHESKSYSVLISDRVNKLRSDNEEVQRKIERLSVVSKEQMHSVLETRGKYKEINRAMIETHSLIKKLDQYQSNINEMRSQVEKEIVSLSSIGRQNTKASYVASKTIETQTEIARSLTVSSKQLDALSLKLKGEVGKFKYEKKLI